jgi:tetratricopeptide (TPR) repeat protein
MSELMGRMTKPMPHVRTAAADAPEALGSVIDRCLQTDPGARYQTTAELVRELEALDEEGRVIVTNVPWFTARRGAGLAALAVVIVAAAVGGSSLWFQRGGAAKPAPLPPVSVLVADFDNKANEPLFDGLVEQALGVGLEGASFITLYSRRDAIRLAAQLSPGARLDSEHATLVAVREGVMRVVTGSIQLQSSRYKLTAQGVDPATSKVLFSLETESGSKDKVLDAVGRMAAKVRRALGDRSVADEAVSGKETFTAGSLEAAHEYVRGQELQWAGKFEEALTSYRQAVTLDPMLGRAYAGLGAVSNSLGRRQEAEEYYKQALQHTDRMTDREKYRTRGGYYLLVRNNEKAREEALALIEKFPADTTALSNLAVAELYRRDMKRSVELGRQALVAMPRNVIRANNLALFLMYAGEFPAAEEQAKAALSINPEFPKAHVAMALSQAATGRADDAERTYRTLAALPGAAPYFAASGLADLHMYLGRLAKASTELEQAAAAEEKGSATRHARLIVTLAEVRALQGRPREAAEFAKRAMTRSTDEAVLFFAGWVLAGAGQAPAAEGAAKALGEHLETEFQIYARLVEGEIALSKGSARDGLMKFQAAQQIADSWLGRFGLARAYLAAGSPAEADSEIDACLKRQGEATAVLFDDVPSIRLVAQLHYYQGRVREALKNAGAVESYKAFLAIKAAGDEQGLVADARRRLEGR